ncbi:thioredoxin family protein [Gilvibacter sediminis]|uniref:thioredoxin family protein n=1 Tax=Gilvibacter sediminis TaxID=379071 RepID=UPI00234FE8D9|nr:thioredoxin domain-containing protein [Gilvibacter sediminis]MDC7998003.1 thioredoxin domain-containing protein [Gilvibacter sediminis]
MRNFCTALLVLFGLTSAFAQTEISDFEIEDRLLVNNDRLIIMDFYATWCAPCKRMEPIIARLEEEFPNVDFYKMDVDKNEADDVLEVESIPTYIFIKNEENLEWVEGAMSYEDMRAKILQYSGGSGGSGNAPITSVTDDFDPDYYHGDSDEFSSSKIRSLSGDWSALNELAWHAYLEHNDVTVLLKAIDIANQSIELDENYFNVDTLAALLYKTGNYTRALKEAKRAISLAKENGMDYEATTELIDNIIDRM